MLCGAEIIAEDIIRHIHSGTSLIKCVLFVCLCVLFKQKIPHTFKMSHERPEKQKGAYLLEISAFVLVESGRGGGI